VLRRTNLRIGEEMMSEENNAEQTTGTSDEHYDLVSVLYHALDVAETYDIYIEDAQEARDQELVDFFRDIQNQNREVVVRAKELLKQRLNRA
jgi:4-diphosphocytidyl-2C-methyl-D-erythritol kinase